jgi:hypothetical protein
MDGAHGSVGVDAVMQRCVRSEGDPWPPKSPVVAAGGAVRGRSRLCEMVLSPLPWIHLVFWSSPPPSLSKVEPAPVARQF